MMRRLLPADSQGQASFRLCALLLILAGMAGCAGQKSQPASPEAEGQQSTEAAATAVTRPLTIVVVDDAGFASIAASEWAAKSDVGLNVKELSASEFAQAIAADAKLDGDVVVYPARFLGELAESKLISAVPKRVLGNESLVFSDILPLLRRQVISWGGETYALPVASRQVVAIVNESALHNGESGDGASDEFAAWQTWQTFDEQLAAGETGDISPIALPLGPGWAASSFLVRSAAYARDSGQISTLFDFRTMKPLINTAPFVRALEELAALAKLGDEKQTEWTPTDALAAVTEGDAAVSLTWMGESAAKEEVATGLRIVPLPGTPQTFNFSTGAWQDRAEDDRGAIPFIGFDDRIASISAASRRQRAAWNLVTQLTTGDMGSRVMTASDVAGPSRGLQERAATKFVSEGLPASVAKQNFEAVSSALRSRVFLSAIRLPGQTEYYAALDDAVRTVIAGNSSASDALDQVAKEWEAITDRLGREKQLAAFERSLGI